jgi:hypothetical protein
MAGEGGSGGNLGFDVRRPGRGLLIAAAGGLVLLIALLFMNWYSVGPGKFAPVQIDSSFLAQSTPPLSAPPGNPVPAEPDFGAWHSAGVLGFFGDLVLLAAGLGAIGLAASRAAGGGPPGDTAARWVTILGVAAVIVVVLRMIFRVDEIDGYKFDAGLKAGIFVALAAAILIAVGGFIARGEAVPVAAAPPAAPPPD